MMTHGSLLYFSKSCQIYTRDRSSRFSYCKNTKNCLLLQYIIYHVLLLQREQRVNDDREISQYWDLYPKCIFYLYYHIQLIKNILKKKWILLVYCLIKLTWSSLDICHKFQLYNLKRQPNWVKKLNLHRCISSFLELKYQQTINPLLDHSICILFL